MAEAVPITDDGARRADRAALLALSVGAVGIAFAPIFVRLSEVGPSATAFHRFALAVPFLWAWLAAGQAIGGGARPRRPLPKSGRDFAILALAGLFFAGDMGFWHWSIRYTTVANATLLANTAPVFVVLGGWLIFGRRFRPLFLIGLAMAMGGTAVLMHTSLSLSTQHLTGDLFGLVTGLFYGAYFLTIERLRARYSTAAIMSCAIPVSAAVMLIAAAASGESLVPPTPRGWAVLFGLAVISQVIGQGLIAFGLAQLPAAFASVSLLVQPILAALFAWGLFDEAVGPVQAAGAVVVLAGIWLARRGSARRATGEASR